jgi:hypothetical protein
MKADVNVIEEHVRSAKRRIPQAAIGRIRNNLIIDPRTKIQNQCGLGKGILLAVSSW